MASNFIQKVFLMRGFNLVSHQQLEDRKDIPSKLSSFSRHADLFLPTPKKHKVLDESLLGKDPLNPIFSNSSWAHHDEVVLKFRLNINCWKLETAQKVYVSFFNL